MADDVTLNKAATIDLAMHVVRTAGLGVPQSSHDAFDVLAKADVIATNLAMELQRMVGFRNVAVHRYQDLDMAVLHAVVNQKLGVFEAFVAAMIRRRDG